MLSDATDPYQPLESKFKVTRNCLEILVKHGFPILITTKSDLVVRDLDLLKENSVVAITITHLDDEACRKLEPGAPPPSARLKAVEKLSSSGVPVIVRVDPIIPGFNSDFHLLEELITRIRDAGAKQVTVSTLKLVPGLLKALKEVAPELAKKLASMYVGGKKAAGYTYLPVSTRLLIIKRARSIALSKGLEFASCREGLAELNTAVCDGTGWLKKGGLETFLNV